MKKVHIILIVIIAVGIGALITTLGNTNTYAAFEEAKANPEKEYHVVGKLSKDKPLEYDPVRNTDEFIFFMKDNNGVENKVVLHKNKPQDFERSEQIVVIGKMQADAFHANDILMKCPSKYNNGQPQIQ